jgi:hypothetical protein
MKFRVTMKDPDGVYDAVMEAAQRSVAGMKLDEDEREQIEESRREKIGEQLQKWFEYGEYLEIDIDLDAGTATVVEQK